MIYEKVDDKTLKAIDTVESINENEYNIEFLKQQEIDILKQKNDFVKARNLELEEVRTLLSEADKLGIKPIAEVELAVELAKE